MATELCDTTTQIHKLCPYRMEGEPSKCWNGKVNQRFKYETDIGNKTARQSDMTGKLPVCLSIV